MEARGAAGGFQGPRLEALYAGNDDDWELVDCLIRRLLDEVPPRLRLSQAIRDALAADILGQVWERFRDGKGPRRRASLCPWLNLIVRSRCVDAVRLRDRDRTRSARLNGAVASTLSEGSAPESLTPMVDAERLRQALDVLGPDDRRLIDLHYFQGYDYKEMAKRLKVKADALRQRALRILPLLRRALGGGSHDKE